MDSYRNAAIALAGLLLVATACRRTTPDTGSETYAQYELSTTATVVFLDSTRAAAVITVDSTDAYFSRLRIRDIALQMGHSNAVIEDTLAWRRRYERSLAASVRSFSSTERELLLEYLQEIYPVVEAKFPGLWPERIELIKITGTHFGPTAFYTRGQGIYIPADQLAGIPSDRMWRRVLLHEIFHLISRNHRELQSDWYRIIGFEVPDAPIVLPDSLEANRLLNPDGIPENWLIRLDTNVLLPVIFRADSLGTEMGFTEAMQERYLPLTLRAGAYYLLPETTTWSKSSAFRRQTGGNTDYIIHPDEILAENFLRLFPELTGLPVPQHPEGRRVVEALGEKLRAVAAKS